MLRLILKKTSLVLSVTLMLRWSVGWGGGASSCGGAEPLSDIFFESGGIWWMCAMRVRRKRECWFLCGGKGKIGCLLLFMEFGGVFIG